jgi:hypothetical protein
MFPPLTCQWATPGTNTQPKKKKHKNFWKETRFTGWGRAARRGPNWDCKRLPSWHSPLRRLSRTPFRTANHQAKKENQNKSSWIWVNRNKKSKQNKKPPQVFSRVRNKVETYSRFLIEHGSGQAEEFDILNFTFKNGLICCNWIIFRNDVTFYF